MLQPVECDSQLLLAQRAALGREQQLTAHGIYMRTLRALFAPLQDRTHLVGPST
jgi:hypothetical protein